MYNELKFEEDYVERATEYAIAEGLVDYVTQAVFECRDVYLIGRKNGKTKQYRIYDSIKGYVAHEYIANW